MGTDGSWFGVITNKLLKFAYFMNFIIKSGVPFGWPRLKEIQMDGKKILCLWGYLCVCAWLVKEKKKDKGLGKAAQSAKKRSSGSGSRTGRRERVKTDQWEEEERRERRKKKRENGGIGSLDPVATRVQIPSKSTDFRPNFQLSSTLHHS